MAGGTEKKETQNEMEERLLGPDYNYSSNIRSPSDLGMSSSGNMATLGNDIGGLISYIQILVTGKSKASKTGQPLGTKFFLETPVNCKDTSTGNDVKRSIYVNNVPDGQLPFISNAMEGSGFSQFEGLLPGVMSNMAQIHPLSIIQAFTAGAKSDCMQITMETIDSDNIRGTASGYVTNVDIQDMNRAWFTNGEKPALKVSENSEGFSTIQQGDTIQQGEEINNNKIDYSVMPNDLLIKFYYGSLGLLGLYIFLKIVLRKSWKLP